MTLLGFLRRFRPANRTPTTGAPTLSLAAPEGTSDPELDFYQGYSWCLNPYPTVGETVWYLTGELRKLGQGCEGWQIAEVLTNVFLLSCALTNAVDEYLRGKTFRLPKQAPAMPFARPLRWALEHVSAVVGLRRRARVRRWRARWRAPLDDFLAIFIAGGTPDPAALATAGDHLAQPLASPLPSDLQAELIYFPSAFRKHDLTHFDALALGRLLMERLPDRRQSILMIGLRTAGSYFAPLVRALLKAEGYDAAEVLTIRPDKEPGSAERAELVRCARAGYLAVIVDDSPRTGDTVVQAVGMARRAGFPPERLAALVPAHPATRDWRRHADASPLADITVLSLEPEAWHKRRLLEPKEVESRLREYFPARQIPNVCLIPSAAADQLNTRLQALTDDTRRARLKCVYEVRLQTADGQTETRYVQAKSVGWGWLGYHAFLAGRRLAPFVPPVLGLRDGILYTEWLPQSPVEPRPSGGGPADRQQQITTAASYVAARVRSLGLANNPIPRLGLHQHHDSFRLLDRVLGRAFGGLLAANLMRPRLRQRLAHQPCPFPTLIDGKMECPEWITGPQGLLKTDYEHHGMGKNELNVVDPAYDLAEAILRLTLSPEEEDRLIQTYTAESGDAGVGERLFLTKLLAGVWATALALKYLFQQPQPAHRQQEFHRQYLGAWHFLTVHAARQGGRYCRPAQAPCWRAPLVVLDIDGVLDRRVFGFPCTTAAGIEAVALLHAHELAVAVDTARSVAEVKAYCEAYGFVGGVAEYGAYAWDAVNNQGRVLLSVEALQQLERVREALAQLPGVFLDDRHQYSIRAYTFENRRAAGRSLHVYLRGSDAESPYEGRAPVPLPTLAVNHLLATLGLDRLSVRQTTIDTTIVAQEVDKGSGLLALLRLAGRPELETIAVGDSEPDLPMFQAARQSFAPAQIRCGRLARSLGCQVARHTYQRGLLDIARAIAHPQGGRCPRCPPSRLWPAGQDLFLDLLQAADRHWLSGLLRALLDPRAYQTFFR